MTRQTGGDEVAAPFSVFQAARAATPDQKEKIKDLAHTLTSETQTEYRRNSLLGSADPHAVYPTSIYWQCDALTLATKDASTIEAIMSTSLTKKAGAVLKKLYAADAAESYAGLYNLDEQRSIGCRRTVPLSAS